MLQANSQTKMHEVEILLCLKSQQDKPVAGR